MRMRSKVVLAPAAYLALTAVVGVLFGSSGRNEAFKPQDEYRLPAWLSLRLGPVDLSINRAVL
ncbi:MAG: hypothetical protein JST59_29055 [Actinobacteria bacterium]|nr:hypothetical protein [Actinomycetota bacterium]